MVSSSLRTFLLKMSSPIWISPLCLGVVQSSSYSSKSFLKHIHSQRTYEILPWTESGFLLKKHLFLTSLYLVMVLPRETCIRIEVAFEHSFCSFFVAGKDFQKWCLWECQIFFWMEVIQRTFWRVLKGSCWFHTREKEKFYFSIIELLACNFSKMKSSANIF